MTCQFFVHHFNLQLKVCLVSTSCSTQWHTSRFPYSVLLWRIDHKSAGIFNAFPFYRIIICIFSAHLCWVTMCCASLPSRSVLHISTLSIYTSFSPVLSHHVLCQSPQSVCASHFYFINLYFVLTCAESPCAVPVSPVGLCFTFLLYQFILRSHLCWVTMCCASLPSRSVLPAGLLVKTETKEYILFL